MTEDGDCLFSAVMAWINVHEDLFSAFDLKRMVGMYMLQHKEDVYDLLEPYLKGDCCSFRRYVDNTIRKGIWGDEGTFDLQTIAQNIVSQKKKISQRELHVFIDSISGSIKMICRMWGIGIAVHTVEYDPMLFGCDKITDCWIHLIYNMSNHYTAAGKNNTPLIDITRRNLILHAVN